MKLSISEMRILRYFHGWQIGIAGWVLLSLSIILLFIFSLPHVMALRKLLLLIAFLVSIGHSREAFLKQTQQLRYPVLCFAMLNLWMLIIAALISDNPLASLSEWVGQWLPALMSFVIGIGLAQVLMRIKSSNPPSIISMTIAVPITLFLCANSVIVISDMIAARSFLTQHPGITDHKANVGYLIALLEPILIADMLGRAVRRPHLLPMPNWATAFILALSVFCLITASSRNGLLIMLFAFLLGAALMFSEIRKHFPLKKILTFAFALLTFISIFMTISYKTDVRWQNFIETVPIAWNIDKDLLWLHADGANLPKTPSGNPVELSAYNRIAWAHEGWRMLIEHPWGMEISRDTFHKLELAKYGYAEMSHSHNSWIDFGLNVGVFGLIVWTIFLSLLIHSGWRAWQTNHEPLGLALAILVIMFAARALLDSIFRNHMIEQFMLVAGLLLTSLYYGKSETRNNVQTN